MSLWYGIVPSDRVYLPSPEGSLRRSMLYLVIDRYFNRKRYNERYNEQDQCCEYTIKIYGSCFPRANQQNEQTGNRSRHNDAHGNGHIVHDLFADGNKYPGRQNMHSPAEGKPCSPENTGDQCQQYCCDQLQGLPSHNIAKRSNSAPKNVLQLVL